MLRMMIRSSLLLWIMSINSLYSMDEEKNTRRASAPPAFSSSFAPSSTTSSPSSPHFSTSPTASFAPSSTTSSPSTPHFSTSPRSSFSAEDLKLWGPSANFKVNGKTARDVEGTLDSTHLFDWHFSKTYQLADVYGNYQEKGARNVAKGLISVVYALPDGQYGIAHHPLKAVYMNGWKRQDGKVEKSVASNMRLDSGERGKTELTDIFCFSEILGLNSKDKNTEEYIKGLLEKKLITGFKDVPTLLQETEKYAHYDVVQPLPIRDLKEKQTHSEKLILIDIDRRFEDLTNKIKQKIPEKSVVNYFIVSMASYRFMCPLCKEMNDKDTPLYNLLMRIKQKATTTFGGSEGEEIKIKVFFSGIASLKGTRGFPSYADCKTPIEIGADDKILYLLRNPFFPLSFDVGGGGFQTVLALNSNYLPYKGEKWETDN